MKYSFSILILIVAINYFDSSNGQNKPDRMTIKTSIPENPVVSIKNDIYNPVALMQKKESEYKDEKNVSGQYKKPNLTRINKDVFGLDAEQTMIESGSYQYIGYSIVTERTGSVPGTIWVVVVVQSEIGGYDEVRIYRFGANTWLLKMVLPLGGYLGRDVDAELIEHSSGAKYLWFVVERKESLLSKKEAYYGIHELGTANAYYGKLSWPGAGSGDEYYNLGITSDNYDYPDIPWIYIVASLDSLTFDNKHVNAQKFAYITSPYDIGNMQINYRPNVLPIYWPNGGTAETHHLFSDIAYYRLSPEPGNGRLIFTYSNVPDDTQIWLSICGVYGENAQFVGTIAGHASYTIGNSLIASPGGGLSSQLMVVFEENYQNSGDWDLVSARSNDLGNTWDLNYIEGSTSTTDKLPLLGTMVSRKGVEDEYYVSYLMYSNSNDSVMSIRSNNGTNSYWDSSVKMSESYQPNWSYPSVGMTNTPGERITVWGTEPINLIFLLMGSFWPGLPAAVEEEPDARINSYHLFQNYPNPYNPSTRIKYQLPEISFVTLKVYDVLGNEIATLVNEEKPIGNYEVEFDGTGLPSGIYFYRIQAGDFVQTKKMILMK